MGSLMLCLVSAHFRRAVMFKDGRGAAGRQVSAAGLRMRPNRRRIGTAVRAVRNAPEDSRRDRQ